MKLLSIRMNFGIIKSMELVPGYLHDKLGIIKLILPYIIGEKYQPDPVEEQVANRVNSSSCSPIMEDSITCIPHTSDEFSEDNSRSSRS